MPFLLAHECEEYCEPFVGGGGVTTAYLSKNPRGLKRVRLNDIDHGIYSIWKTILECPEDLKSLIRGYAPTVDDFDKLRELLTCGTDSTLESAFAKICVHQMSYSGLGMKSGGPLGGRDQKSKYKIDCRWSPKSLCSKIDNAHRLLTKYETSITAVDFGVSIESGRNAIIFADPPYYDKGKDLYQFAFTEADHVRLKNSLAAKGLPFFLTYDDCPQIRELYQAYNVQSTDVIYTITTSRTKPELLITSCV